MDFKPIELADRKFFEAAYHRCRHEGSECSFTNLFIWRKPLEILWTQVGEAICVVVLNDGPAYALHPCAEEKGDVIAAVGELAKWFRLQEKTLLIKGLEQPLAELIGEEYPSWSIEHDRDEDDYIYSIKELIELKGRKFEAKRHHIRTFLRNTPDFAYEPLNAATALECIPVAREWLARQRSGDEIMQAETFAVEQALTYFDDLKLKGGLIRVGGKIEAFTVGEALSEDTIVIHIEKANPEFVGLYQMINREFLSHAWSDMTYVNREEDMGIPGLRAAKQSYRPIRMVEKYRVSES